MSSKWTYQCQEETALPWPNDSEIPHIPLIFLTASKQPGLREKAMAFDAHAFFEKPFESDELIQSIRTCLQVSSSFLPA